MSAVHTETINFLGSRQGAANGNTHLLFHLGLSDLGPAHRDWNGAMNGALMQCGPAEPNT